MTGICGIALTGKRRKIKNDLGSLAFYLQHRGAPNYGFCVDEQNGGRLEHDFGRGSPFQVLSSKGFSGDMGIAAVSNDKQPYLSRGQAVALDGRLSGYQALRTGAKSDLEFVSKLIYREGFVGAIKRLFELIEGGRLTGDFAVTALAKKGVYAARGYGRAPLRVGSMENANAVSSESVSFSRNLGFKDVRDVKPGEVLLLDREGVHSVGSFDINPRYCLFSWVYSCNICSVLDGMPVDLARYNMGKHLGERLKEMKITPTVISPIPDSGRGHAKGVASVFGMPDLEVFSKYPGIPFAGGRSYIHDSEVVRRLVAKLKLIPIPHRIRGQRIAVVDDSIVRGTQTEEQMKLLNEFGAEETYALIAMAPLRHACGFSNTTRRDSDLIANRMNYSELKRHFQLNVLLYSLPVDLIHAVGQPKEKLCMSCLDEKLDEGFFRR